MSRKLILDKKYKDWIGELSKKYRAAQIKASIAVNSQMLRFYWELGRGISLRQEENKYGTAFFEQLSRDLKEVLPEAKGFSTRNLKYIARFYQMYSPIWQQPVAESEETNRQQLVAKLFSIPWGHHTLLIDKYFNEPATALFYVGETIEHGWSRAILDHMLDTNLHLRQGKAITNFTSLLPDVTSELAQEITKDPYIFNFRNLQSHIGKAN